MNLIKNGDGFSIEKNNVGFDFKTAKIPTKENGFFVLMTSGNIPVPEIRARDRLLLPVDEGIAITADEEYEKGQFDCECISRNFCSREGTMGMIVVERAKKFLLIALENTPYASYEAKRIDGLYRLSMRVGKPSLISYAVFDSLKDACKAYRSLKKDTFVPLFEKIKNDHEIEKLAQGAVFWIWNDNYDKVMYSPKDTDTSVSLGEELLKTADLLYKSGIRNAMIGIFFESDSKYTKQLYEKYGYICTQYDNYNDVLNPELLKIIPNNRVKRCDYTFRRMKDYPDGVQINSDGNRADAWALKGFDGKMHAQNTLCPLVAKKRMTEEIPQILLQYPYYKGRFVDVYGGNLAECFSKKHSLTKEECLKVKNEAFFEIGKMGLITGTEDGFEDIINNLVYTEGMHSPVYFRIDDAGRKHAHMLDSHDTAHTKKHMLNPRCRVPLWHLVYHECMLTFPYWGDSTESSLELTKDKILFACLYGCPPLYSFFLKDFDTLFESITESYKKITEITGKTAGQPMTDFEILTDDYMVQRSTFGDKYRITVNFSDGNLKFEEI